MGEQRSPSCRAAGINIHRLLLSALVLGALVSAATYYAWNYLIPTLSGQVEALTRRDLPTIVMAHLPGPRVGARCALPSLREA